MPLSALGRAFVRRRAALDVVLTANFGQWLGRWSRRSLPISAGTRAATFTYILTLPPQPGSDNRGHVGFRGRSACLRSHRWSLLAGEDCGAVACQRRGLLWSDLDNYGYYATAHCFLPVVRHECQLAWLQALLSAALSRRVSSSGRRVVCQTWAAIGCER